MGTGVVQANFSQIRLLFFSQNKEKVTWLELKQAA